MSFVFSVLSGACSVYLFICFIRVILTWVPNAQYSSFGRFLAALCDPYLSWFRRFSFLRAGMLDFSPAVAMGVLVALSSVFAQLSLQGRILFGASLATLLGVLWSIVASLLGFFILLLMIRLFVVIFWPNSSSQLWQILDRTLYPIVFRFTKYIFGKQRYVQYRTALIAALVVTILAEMAGSFLINMLGVLLMRLPF